MPGPEHAVRLQLRRRDMDVLGHLNHTVYNELFFEARSSLLEPVRTDEERYVLARSEVEYLHEVRLEDGHVHVLVRVAELGRKSLTLEHELRLPDGTLAARGRAVLVAWDVAGRCSRELSPRERTALLDGG